MTGGLLSPGTDNESLKQIAKSVGRPAYKTWGFWLAIVTIIVGVLSLFANSRVGRQEQSPVPAEEAQEDRGEGTDASTLASTPRQEDTPQQQWSKCTNEDSPLVGQQSESGAVVRFGSDNERLFLSPDRKAIAVTTSLGGALTSVVDLDGEQLVSPRAGSFVSWLPDSSGVLLSLSEFQNKSGKTVFVLTKTGDYRDFGLPLWTHSADISPISGDIAYSRTNEYTDASNLWLRTGGQDTMLVQGDDERLAWPRWSPRGDKLAFLRSKIGAKTSGEARQLWVVNADGSGATKVAESVLWAYPPVWSPDGKRLLIAIQEGGGGNSIAVDYETLESNLWEYDAVSHGSRKLTPFVGKRVLHPVYSSDGTDVLFIANQNGSDEVWLMSGSRLCQFTNDGVAKRYPIAL